MSRWLLKITISKRMCAKEGTRKRRNWELKIIKMVGFCRMLVLVFCNRVLNFMLFYFYGSIYDR